MGILFLPIALSLKLAHLLLWLVTTALKLSLLALKLVWAFGVAVVAAIFAFAGSMASAVRPGRKKAG